MSSSSRTTGPEAGLDECLREFDSTELPVEGERIDRMFANVKGECAKSDKTLKGFLRSRSTMVRRLIVLSVFAGLAVAGFYSIPMVDESLRNPQWVATLVVFCLLLVVAMMVVTRPVHRPSLPRWQVVSLVGLAIAATVLAAFWPSSSVLPATHQHDTGVIAGACMGFGLLLGVPVYALLRLVDRGNTWGSVVAAAAAGLAGNFVLKAHCALETTSHVLLGHASVAVLFVVGLGLVHRLIPSR